MSILDKIKKEKAFFLERGLLPTSAHLGADEGEELKVEAFNKGFELNLNATGDERPEVDGLALFIVNEAHHFSIGFEA